ncbi:Mur ligase [Peniophora sp. CONT]|nr:Mur ligase [Peniophora sp. CONT]
MSIDLSLDRIKHLLAHLPTYNRPTIHIAGTNGKGSVSALISSILRTAGLTVGRFNSPHLVSVRDGISIYNKPISEEEYAAARAEVERIDKECDAGASSFEILTSTALLAFQRAELDVVVLEVGLGGRLDATNAIPGGCVLVSAVTAVDLDHQAFLGNTVEAIAREKTAIARPGRPFVVGPQKHDSVLIVAKAVIAEAGSDFIAAVSARPREWDDSVDGPRTDSSGFAEPLPQPVVLSMPCYSSPVNAQLPLFGAHQLDNLGTATTIISTLLTHPSCVSRLSLKQMLSPETISSGIRSTRWPGRLSYHKLPYSKLDGLDADTNVLVDGAHNAASAATLSDYIAHVSATQPQAPLAFILALSHSPPKTPAETLSSLFAFAHTNGAMPKISVAATGFSSVEGMPWVKPVSPNDITRVAKDILPDVELWTAPDATADHLNEALRWASEQAKGGLVVIAGSLYLVADFYRLLGDGTTEL